MMFGKRQGFDAMQTKPAQLILKNGMRFNGFSPLGQTEEAEGEVVFNTGMAGYPESLTDPSYTGQILVFTYPLIGNYGVPAKKDWESVQIHVKGVVVSDLCKDWSSYTGQEALLDWFQSQNIPILIGLDTRALTKLLRSSGTIYGKIINCGKTAQTHFQEECHSHVAKVSIKERQTLQRGAKTVIAVDCGMKENIIRMLSPYSLTVHCVPYDYDFIHEDYDGIILSNGPGDPSHCSATVNIIQKALQKQKPIFGICLGAQLLALAAGAKTYKLRFGHRGQNQPCIDLRNKRCYMTSQNHGYAIDATSLPSDWHVTFENLNDGSVEGISHASGRYSAVQFHPEGAPGPSDTQWLFEEFYQRL